jgi:hypothetical protein
VALDGADGSVGVGDSLTLGNLTYDTLAGLGESYDGRSGSGAFGVSDNNRLAAFHNGYAGVGGSQIDTNDFTHDSYPPNLIYQNVWLMILYNKVSSQPAPWQSG